MGFLAIAYPDISQRDFEWIQSIRKQHDPKYFDIVKPHITLVFNTNKLGRENFTEHITSKLSNVSDFKVKLDSTRLVEDDSKDFFHVFLIPSTGYDEINMIHDSFYEGALRSELRQDILFIPHLGIGTGSESQMTKLNDDLKKQDLSIEGRINKVSIVEYDGIRVKDFSVITLGNGQ